MAQTFAPTVDAALCSGWTEQERDLYNKLPFYLVKMQLHWMKSWPTWAKLCGKAKWTPNMGATMRSVSKEPSPILRQFAFPNPICDTAKKDIVMVRERSVDSVVYHQKFESLILNFCPSFRDFLTDHVDRTGKDLTEKMMRFQDVFLRGHIYNQSPFVFLPNKLGGTTELTSAPIGVPTSSYDAANKVTTLTGDGKTTAWHQAIFPLVGNPGNLSLNAINLALNVIETDMRIPPFSGNGMPTGDNSPLSGKYVLVCSGEAYNQFIYDPFLKQYKSIDLDIITSGFKGSLFGRVTCKLEDLPIRISADGTMPDPETVELNPAAYNYGESVPNQAYVDAPYEVAFMVGYGEGYKAIEVGPPPKDFAGNGMPDGFGKMNWNGELIITKNLIVPCLDGDGNQTYDTNKYGENLQIISHATYGIVAEQRRSIIPIIFKRWRGARNPVSA